MGLKQCVQHNGRTMGLKNADLDHCVKNNDRTMGLEQFAKN